ncbi:hypothetical protein [Streptomyces sp. 147326]|uniref:hypothetical protein n=1 Tax=Streptomyces sp. 147326 TaxID=3074379 RepID=UPI0038575C14
MDTIAEIWASTQSLAMWHAFAEDSDRALCRSNIRAHSAARFTYAETRRPFQVPRPHCEGCRKKLAAPAATAKAAPAPVDRRPEVAIPGPLADILSDSNLATGADDHDPASKATREALDAGRCGRGRTLMIRPGSTDVLDVISEYADTVLHFADDYTSAEVKAAQTWVDRAGHARSYYAKPAQEQQAPEAVDREEAAAFAAAVRAADAVEHAEETGAAVATVEEAEALYAAALVTEAEADEGTWRGAWIGEQQPADVLFAIEGGPIEQGALFTAPPHAS